MAELTAAPDAAAPVLDAAPLVGAAPVAETVVETAAPAAEAPTPVAETVEPVETAETAAEAAPAEGAEETAAESAAEDGKAEETKAESDVKAEPDAKAEGAEAPAEEAATPAYTDFKLPEGMVADGAQLSAYGNILGKYGLTQAAGQELMDFGGTIIKQAQEQMLQRQQDAFQETRAAWVKAFDKQTGNRRDTVLNDARGLIDSTIKNADEKKALWDALAVTGAGDHPAVITALAKIAKRLNERAAPPQGLAARPAAGDPATRRYGAARS